MKGLCAVFLLVPAFAEVPFEIQSNLVSPQPVAQMVTWTAESSAGEVWYRYRTRPAGGEFQMVRDFSPVKELAWTAAEWEGGYEIEVTARNQATGETSARVIPFSFAPRATGAPLVSATGHPLVALYSAPPCPEGATMAVEFEAPPAPSIITPAKACQPGRTMNFYLAGMKASAAYRIRHRLNRPGEPVEFGPELSHLTGTIPVDLPGKTETLPALERKVQGFIVHGPIFPERPYATDLTGAPVWYYPGNISYLTRVSSGGRFWGQINSPGGRELQLIREWDAVGMTLRETNAAQINEQLRALGRREMGGFHHEVGEMPNGKIVVLAGIERKLAGVQGPDEINILGDYIFVLDRNLQVEWIWDAFEHMDVTRKALLDEPCSIGGCPQIFDDVDAADWVHGNSVQLTPDGHFLYSARHQDWVLKIDYSLGAGDGTVLWRLGAGGDFELENGTDRDWFSHQHDAQMLSDGRILLFDNANLHFTLDPTATSRGQLYELDESRRTARLVLNADLGLYAFALGSAQLLADGNFHFDVGWLLPSNEAVAVETDPTGQIVYSLTSTRPAYRSYRVVDLYSAP
jgi:arylsulfate sulfotransferase